MNDVLKWINIAVKDIEASEVLFENKHFSQSYFYFQQATEKGNKALWILLGVLNKNELKKFGHNQFKPLRRITLEQKENIDFIRSIDDNISFVSSHPLIKDIDEYRNQLDGALSFIDGTYNYDLVNIDISELDEMINTLKELKDSKLILPKDYKIKYKKALTDYISWLKNFETETIINDVVEFEKIISDKIEFEKFLKLSYTFLETIYDIIYCQITLFFCAVLTIQHSSMTRYPDDANKTNPIELYNESLSIVKRQTNFLEHLKNALKRLVPLAHNYKPPIADIKEKEPEYNKNKYSDEVPKPDSAWEIFGIKNKRDFISKFFVSKNCHDKVPDQIVKELEFSEQIQSHSYYFYPMYGDAFSRQTRVFEMAVKSRSKELNISVGNKSLKRLIDEISIGYPEDFCFNLDWGRKMRNMNAHPEMTTMYGSILKIPLLRITNIINDMFRDASFFNNEIKELKKLKDRYKHYKKGLWKLDRFLVHSIEPIAIRNDFTLWVFHPIYDKYPQSMGNLFSQEPFFACLKSFKGANDDFIATNINNVSIKAESTLKDENIIISNRYHKQFDSSPDKVKRAMEMTLNQNIFYALEDFKHKVNCLQD